MGCIRPATPGFIVTLTATILLAVVSFCVPYVKSVFFLRATIQIGNGNGSVTFGTLGYCLELPNGTTCSKPSIGYELDINSLVGLPIDIPVVVVKWLTYALFLHVVALALSAGSAIFGLLAHVREMSMACCSTCVSGFAAGIALLAFIFDLALFFIAKARINKVQGGSAQIGNAIWLTLAAWLLLFFSGCFYALGRCCIQKRKPRGGWDRAKDTESVPPQAGYPDQLRLDAVKAEADRKARQNVPEGGLPAFHETQPLTARIEGDAVYTDDPATPLREHYNVPATGASGYGGNGGYAGGYVQATPGTRAVDEYYSSREPAPVGYPPQPQGVPQRQPSGHTLAPSTYSTSPYASPPVPTPNNQYLSAAPQQYAQDPRGNPIQEYGHTAGGSSYHSAASHQQYPSNYSQRDPHPAPAAQPAQPSYNAPAGSPPTDYRQYYSGQPPAQQYNDRSYTLGGGGYGESTVPALLEPQAQDQHNLSYFPHPSDARGLSTSPAPINTGVPGAPSSTSPVKGPRPPRTMSPTQYSDSPPVYDAGIPGAYR